MGIGQQTYLPCTRETRETDVRHVQKTRIQDLSSVIRLKSPSSTSVKFYLRLLVVQALMWHSLRGLRMKCLTGSQLYQYILCTIRFTNHVPWETGWRKKTIRKKERKGRKCAKVTVPESFLYSPPPCFRLSIEIYYFHWLDANRLPKLKKTADFNDSIATHWLNDPRVTELTGGRSLIIQFINHSDEIRYRGCPVHFFSKDTDELTAARGWLGIMI